MLKKNDKQKPVLKLVYKKGWAEEEAELNLAYTKKLEEVKRLKKDMQKVNEILHNKARYFKVF